MSVRRSVPAILALWLMVCTVPIAAQDRIVPLEGVVNHGPIEASTVPQHRTPDGRRRAAQAFVRTELFFGTSKPDGVVTPEEFQTFLDCVVTPLFPDGLTVVKADGQFKGANGVIVKEASFLLILLYPLENQLASSGNIDYIRSAYVRLHQQESVLRVDDPLVVWVQF